jgi:hypothetical protein
MSLFLAMGAWGDTYAALGNILAHPKFRCLPDVVHYGMDPAIPQFIRAQPWVGEVHAVAPASESEYRQVTRVLCEEPYVKGRTEDALSKVWSGPEALVQTHVCLDVKRARTVYRWADPALPEHSLVWARQHLRMPFSGNLLLLNPTSTFSTPDGEHWPQWRAAVRWLIENTGNSLVLVGAAAAAKGLRELVAGLECDRLQDLVGRTPSQMEVLALAKLCDGIVCTSNNLSMWSVMTGTPAVVALAKVMRPENYFYQWIQSPVTRLIGFQDPLENFKEAVKRLWV